MKIKAHVLLKTGRSATWDGEALNLLLAEEEIYRELKLAQDLNKPFRIQGQRSTLTIPHQNIDAIYITGDHHDD